MLRTGLRTGLKTGLRTGLNIGSTNNSTNNLIIRPSIQFPRTLFDANETKQHNYTIKIKAKNSILRTELREASIVKMENILRNEEFIASEIKVMEDIPSQTRIMKKIIIQADDDIYTMYAKCMCYGFITFAIIHVLHIIK